MRNGMRLKRASNESICPEHQSRDILLTFYEFPAEDWIHIRTTNPIELTSPRFGCGPPKHTAASRALAARSWSYIDHFWGAHFGAHARTIRVSGAVLND